MMLRRFAIGLVFASWTAFACASGPSLPAWLKKAEVDVARQARTITAQAKKVVDLPRIEQAADEARELWRLRDHVDIAALPALSAFELSGSFQSLLQALGIVFVNP